MRIFYPTTIKPTGGSSTFAQKFKRGIEAKGHTVTFEPTSQYDLLFVNAQCRPRHLIHAKLRRKPIVQRLDGTYYRMTVAGKHWRRRNFPLQIVQHFFATLAIYQSQYSKKSCAKFLSLNQHIPSKIIYNGVDTEHFTPKGPIQRLRDTQAQHLFITASRFRRADQLLPLIEGFNIYRHKYNANSKLIVIGDISPNLKIPEAALNIVFLGPIPNKDLPSYLRAADAFLHTHLNPPCPNNVIEAMTAGLPICGVADGAMPEITDPGQNSELIDAPGDGYFQPRQLDLASFAANLNKIMQNQPTYAQHSRHLALQRFQLGHMIDNYLAALQQ